MIKPKSMYEHLVNYLRIDGFDLSDRGFDCSLHS